MKKVKRNIFSSVVAVGALLSIFSCADNNNATVDEVSFYETLDKWVESNYPGLHKEIISDGIYMEFSEKEGSEKKYPSDTAYVKINYTAKNINGTVIATTDEILAAQLGTRVPSTRYVPFQFRLSNWSRYAGITGSHAYAIGRMAIGDTVEMIISGAAGYEAGGTMYEGFGGTKSGAFAPNQVAHVVMVLEDFTEKIDAANELIVEDYKHYSATAADWKSIQSGKIVYRFTSPENTNIADSLRNDSTLMIRYTGRFADDGFVFDTNIADTARKYNMYNVLNSDRYKSGDKFEFETIANDSTGFAGYIESYKYMINLMRLGDKVNFVTFPKFAYGEAGQYGTKGTLIFTESPLVFDLEIIKNEYQPNK